MTKYEYLVNEERRHQIWLLKFEREHAALRKIVAEKHGELAVQKVERMIENEQRVFNEHI